MLITDYKGTFFLFRSYEVVPQEEDDGTANKETKTQAHLSDTMGQQTCRIVLAKGLLQIVCLIALLMPMAYIYVFTSNFEPYHREDQWHMEQKYT